MDYPHFYKTLVFWNLDCDPHDFLEMAWWQILIGFFIMHYTAGLILSLTFQLAHVVEDTQMPLPDEETGNMKNTWAIHQLFTR